MEMDRSTKKHVFKVPEGYFDNFSSQLLDKIQHENPVIVKKSNIKKFTYYISGAIAATILLFFGIKPFVANTSNKKLSSNEIEEFIEYHPSFVISTELIESLDSEDIKELEKTIQLDQKEINEYIITNIDLEYYLNN